VGDCVIRAISTALNQDWQTTFIELSVQGLMMCDLTSSNAVWGEYLKRKGYQKKPIVNDCNCYTIDDFCRDCPQGTYILGTGTHAVAVIDGDYYDFWQSGNELPIYYFEKESEC
jgi:hypothetical protein